MEMRKVTEFWIETDKNISICGYIYIDDDRVGVIFAKDDCSDVLKPSYREDRIQFLSTSEFRRELLERMDGFEFKKGKIYGWSKEGRVVSAVFSVRDDFVASIVKTYKILRMLYDNDVKKRNERGDR